jgi:hypothetical protein
VRFFLQGVVELTLLLKYDLSLQDVRDEPRPDGTTLAGRTQQLMKKIADDIVACGNLCDTYAKKGLVGMSASKSID